jgi:SAM-dependent methyltransferase
LPEVQWIGLDIPDSPEVRSRTRGDCEFRIYDGVNIPFDDCSIDVIYSRQVFEHVRHPEALLKEVARVLRRGGVFIGSVSQLEPLHSFSYWNFTYYGFSVIAIDAGLELCELRPGIDGLSLVGRNLLLFGLRFNLADVFLPWFTSESPLNGFLERYLAGRGGDHGALNKLKLTYCGHVCFKFTKT